MTFEKARKRIIDKRIERMDEILRMEASLYEEMNGDDLEMFVVEEPEKIQKELIKLETPFLVLRRNDHPAVLQPSRIGLPVGNCRVHRWA